MSAMTSSQAHALDNGVGIRRRAPTSTYRLQLARGFGFREVAELVPYLRELGISDCYFSPFLQTSSPDAHGYDIVDHGHFNAALGSEADYESLCRVLAANGMG